MINLNSTTQLKTKKFVQAEVLAQEKVKPLAVDIKDKNHEEGVAIKSFEGGQMPLYRRLPKRGFNPIKSTEVKKNKYWKNPITFGQKKKKTNETINLSLLKKAKLISNNCLKLKILGNGELKDKITLEVDFISKSVKDKLDKTDSILKIKK